MIRRVHFSDFRALKAVRLDLEAFTVLVGPNASGKSSVFAALESDRKLKPADAWRGSGTPSVVIEMDNGTQVVRGHAKPPPSAVVHFDLAEMRASRMVESAGALDRSGANLVNVFATMPRSTQGLVAEQLAAFVPAIGDVHHKPGPSQGAHRLVFRDRWQESLWYEPDQVSDGTIYALGYAVLAHQLKRPALLCIEEPERSLHPYLLGHVVQLLRRLSVTDDGAPGMQVIVATQSAELLEHVEPHEVRFLGRDEDGNVVVRSAPVDQPGWDEAVNEYAGSMGQMWLSGGLGGVPAE